MASPWLMPGSMFKKPLGMKGLSLGCGSMARSQELGYAFLDHLGWHGRLYCCYRPQFPRLQRLRNPSV